MHDAYCQQRIQRSAVQFIFGHEDNRAWTLSVYNAVNGTSYTDPELIQINTIKDVLYLGMHNDVSFLIAGEVNLYEQQSTFNPNMPLRLLQYLGNLYEKYVTENNLNKYGSERIDLPVPKLVVFYNGEKEQPDELMLRLSDAFPEGADADVEVRVRMLNINHGRNSKLLNACQPLKEYSWLMNRIRDNIRENKKAGIDKDQVVIKAVDQAIEETPMNYVLKPFLEVHRAEVKGMLLTEYNEAEAMKLFELDGERRGIRIGRTEGENNMADLMQRLFAEGRVEDARRAASDQAFRNHLFKEYSIM